jgi:hypothetical protein
MIACTTSSFAALLNSTYRVDPNTERAGGQNYHPENLPSRDGIGAR